MLFTTTTQWVAVAIALVAGWLFGLASHPGGKKWKARYLAERDAHAATTKRASELERDNTRLAKAAPVSANMTTARDRAEPAYRDSAHREDLPPLRDGERPYRDDRI
jgi:hypothetical protein